MVDLKDMIYYISVNGLSTMDQIYIEDSIKKGKYLKRKIRGWYFMILNYSITYYSLFHFYNIMILIIILIYVYFFI